MSVLSDNAIDVNKIIDAIIAKEFEKSMKEEDSTNGSGSDSPKEDQFVFKKA